MRSLNCSAGFERAVGGCHANPVRRWYTITPRACNLDSRPSTSRGSCAHQQAGPVHSPSCPCSPAVVILRTASAAPWGKPKPCHIRLQRCAPRSAVAAVPEPEPVEHSSHAEETNATSSSQPAAFDSTIHTPGHGDVHQSSAAPTQHQDHDSLAAHLTQGTSHPTPSDQPPANSHPAHDTGDSTSSTSSEATSSHAPSRHQSSSGSSSQHQRRSYTPYSPPLFLRSYPKPAGVAYNVMSFLGKKDPNGGKYFVPSEKYSLFLKQYTNALVSGQPLYLAESYQQQPYR
jgi:hypothetical protein